MPVAEHRVEHNFYLEHLNSSYLGKQCEKYICLYTPTFLVVFCCGNIYIRTAHIHWHIFLNIWTGWWEYFNSVFMLTSWELYFKVLICPPTSYPQILMWYQSQRRQKATFLECFFCMFSALQDVNSVFHVESWIGTLYTLHINKMMVVSDLVLILFSLTASSSSMTQIM